MRRRVVEVDDDDVGPVPLGARDEGGHDGEEDDREQDGSEEPRAVASHAVEASTGGPRFRSAGLVAA